MSFNNLFYLFRYRQERGNNCTKSHNSFVRFMGIGGNQEPPDFVVSNTAFLIVPSSKSWLPRIIKLSKKTVKSLIKELSYFDSFCLITYFLKQNKNNSFFIMMCVKIFVNGKQKTQKKTSTQRKHTSLDANFSDEALSTDPDRFGQTVLGQRGRSTRAHAAKYSTTIPAVMAPSKRRKRRSTGHTARCVSIRDPPRRSFRHATFLH